MAQAELKAKISLNDTVFVNGMKRAQALAGSVGKNIGRNLSSFITSPLSMIAATALTALSFSGAKAGMQNIMAQGAALNDLSDVTGMSIAQSARLAEMWRTVEGDTEGLSGALLKMRRTLGGITVGSPAHKALMELGIDLRALGQMSADEQFLTIGNAISKMGTSVDRARVASAIFGKTGEELVKIWKDFADLDPAMFERRSKLLAENAAALDEADKAVTRAKISMEGFFAGAMVKLAPTITEIADKLSAVDWVGFGERAATAIGGIAKIVMTLREASIAVFKAIFDNGKARFMQLANSVVKIINSILGDSFGGMFKKFQVSVPFSEQDVDAALSDAAKSNQFVVSMKDTVVGAFMEGANAVKSAFIDASKPVEQAAQTVTEAYQQPLLEPSRRIIGGSLIDGLPDLKKRTNPPGYSPGDTKGYNSSGNNESRTQDSYIRDPFQLTNSLAGQKAIPVGSGSALSFRERGRFEDARVAAGGARSASTPGAYNAIKFGDTRRRKEYEAQQERMRLGQGSTNEILGGISQKMNKLVE